MSLSPPVCVGVKLIETSSLQRCLADLRFNKSSTFSLNRLTLLHFRFITKIEEVLWGEADLD